MIHREIHLGDGDYAQIPSKGSSEKKDIPGDFYEALKSFGKITGGLYKIIEFDKTKGFRETTFTSRGEVTDEKKRPMDLSFGYQNANEPIDRHSGGDSLNG